MAYVLDENVATVGDLDDFGGITPCPPPEGCPPGTVAKPCGRPDATGKVGPTGCYPNHSSKCCKAIAGYTPPEQVGFGTEAGTQSGSGMLRITPSGRVLPDITTGLRPPKPPIGTTLPGPTEPGPTEPGPSGPASGGPPVYVSPFVNWLSQNKWWVVVGSAALVLAVTIMVWPSKKLATVTVPMTSATADWEY